MSLEDETDFLAFQVLLLGSRILGPFQIAGEIEKVSKLPWRVVLDRQQRSIAKIQTHEISP
jgi:hypothetical protein